MSNQTSGQTEKLSFWDRFSDYMNPILVKEVRQAFKGRGFITTFGLLLASCWVISFFGAIAAGASLEYYSYAEQFFSFYFLPLAAAIGIVVPFLAYTSMLNERHDDTFEMVSITSLNARRIVNGKLVNAVVQILLFYSAITPFIAFSSLLQGFRFTPVFFILVMSFFWSVGLCSLTLLVSTLANNRLMQGFLALVMVGFLFLCFSFSFPLMFESGFWMIPAEFEVYAGLAGICLLFTAISLLLREITVAQITFESDNRSSGIRIVCSLLLILFWVALPITVSLTGLTGMPVGAMSYMVSYWTVISCILLSLVILFVCTEPLEMSRRVKKQVQSVAQSAGILAFPFLPGCARGYVYALLHLLPLAFVCILSMPGITSRYDGTMVGLIFVLYLCVYAGLAAFVSQLLRQWFPSMRTTHAPRAAFLILVSIAAIVPHIVVIVLEESRVARIDYSAMMVTSPVATISYAAGKWELDGELFSAISMLVLMSIAMFILNLGAILRSGMETFSLKGNARPKYKKVLPPAEKSTTEENDLPLGSQES